MKRLVCVSMTLAFVLMAALVFAEVAYVSSFSTAMYQNPTNSSSKLAQLSKGNQLVVLTHDGAWIKVRYRNQTGWVQKMFTSATMPGAQVSILGSATKAARLHARTRASSDVTAASARGLLDNSRTRDVDSANAYDPAALSRMESLHIADEDLIKFLSDGGIKVSK